MTSARNTARIAGALYLLSSAAVGIPLIYVSNLIVNGNAAATAKNILVSEMVFRACMVSELTGLIVFIFMVRVLYRLLNTVDETCASLMVTLGLIAVPISFLNVLNEIAALTLLHGANFLSAFDPPQRDALAMLFLGLHGEGASLGNVFWGLWLFPFGVLVMKSGFLPRILGVLLIVNCVAWVVVTLTGLLLPRYLGVVNRFAIIPELGELWMMGWLLVRGVRARPANGCTAT